MPAPAPAPAPAPEPDPTPPPPRQPVPGAEVAPTLAAPQEGSTAITGNDSQGIYENARSYTFVTSAGRLMFKDTFRWVFGSVKVDGLNWSFVDPTMSLDSFGKLEAVKGSGSFDAKKEMKGEYTAGSSTLASTWGPLKYSAANALAVSQQDMAGKWSVDSGDGLGMSIDIDASGTVTGTTAGREIGVCSLSGTLLQTEPLSLRNMFNLRVKAANAATGTEKACALDEVESYDGLAGVIFVPASVFESDGHFRTLAFHAGTPTGAFLTNFLRKR